MRRLYMLLFSLLLFTFGCTSKEDPSPVLTIESEILQLVNEHRVSQGMTTVQSEPACQREARIHSENMATGEVDFGHDGFADRFDLLQSEIQAIKMGENVALGQTTAEEVMEDWINSPGHKANIEGDFTHLGVGVFETNTGTKYFTQIFVKL